MNTAVRSYMHGDNSQVIETCSLLRLWLNGSVLIAPKLLEDSTIRRSMPAQPESLHSARLFCLSLPQLTEGGTIE